MDENGLSAHLIQKVVATLSGNKFLHIENYDLAQELLNEQFSADFSAILNGVLPLVFPHMSEITNELTYYWTLWQSEVAKDYIFTDKTDLEPLMGSLLRYALVNGTGDRILRYFGSPVKANGQPHHASNPEIQSRANCWYDGLRMRHWNSGNSVKFYNEHNVLRFEATMNNPAKFKVHRHSEDQDASKPKKFMPMRKGIADINLRAEVSNNIVNRFTEHMAAAENKTLFSELLSTVSKPLLHNGKRVRALDVFGKDLDLIRAISDPVFDVANITNAALQKKLANTSWAKGMTGKQLSGRISRHLALLRQHGLIKKLPNQRKYTLTDKGRKLSSAVNIALASDATCKIFNRLA